MKTFFLILVLTLLILVIIIWRFLRKKNSKPEESNTQVVVDPYKEAIEAIDKLQGQKNINPKPFVFKLSEILRIYVERLFNLPAMELTGKSFLEKSLSMHSLKIALKKCSRNLLSRETALNTHLIKTRATIQKTYLI